MDQDSHLFKYEAGAISFLSRLMSIAIKGTQNGFLSSEDVVNAGMWSDDIHVAKTQIVALENTLNGRVMPLKQMQ